MRWWVDAAADSVGSVKKINCFNSIKSNGSVELIPLVLLIELNKFSWIKLADYVEFNQLIQINQLLLINDLAEASWLTQSSQIS